MLTSLRNRIVYSKDSSKAIGDAASQQRLAYNAAVDHTLDHPNISKYDLQQQLTAWRDEDPEKWHGKLKIQRTGLERGRLAVKAFDKASIPTLRECEKEVKLRRDPKPQKARKPKHPVRPGRDPDPQRLYRSRKSPTTLVIEDTTNLTVHSPKHITIFGIDLLLAKPLPKDADIRALTIIERNSSRKQGRNRPLADRSYNVHIIIAMPDPEPKDPLETPTGIDVGIANTISTADGRHRRQPYSEDIASEVDRITVQQKRLKPKGRQWTKLQNKKRKLLRKHRNRTDNWEHHITRKIAQEHSLVAVEKLNLAGMKRSAKGTPENPGSNVKAKSGLNRSLSRSRPGSVHTKLERHCQKNGTTFVKVPPRGTSTTCPLCGCRTRENRKNQAEFHCQRCRLEAHADTVGAINIRNLGIAQALLVLILWSHDLGTSTATIRRRQGLPPSASVLNLLPRILGVPVVPTAPAVRWVPGTDLARAGNAGPATPALRTMLLEPMLSI